MAKGDRVERLQCLNSSYPETGGRRTSRVLPVAELFHLSIPSLPHLSFWGPMAEQVVLDPYISSRQRWSVWLLCSPELGLIGQTQTHGGVWIEI